MSEENVGWSDVELLFESSVRKLNSPSEEIKVLKSPELVKEYISKYRLSSDSAEIKLLSTPELVKEYISKHELSSETFDIIISKHKKVE
jgi:hypothetical protein